MKKKPPQQQGSLLDVIKAKEEAIQRVDQHANGAWKQRALESLWQVASRLPTLTADDLREDMDAQARGDDHFPETHDLRATGAVMQQARRAGWIEGTDRQRPGRFACSHGRPQQVWVSLIVRGNHERTND